MAAANAVLDVIENEKLYTHVAEVSTYLLTELEKLKLKHEIIGDIRFVQQRHLFWGEAASN